MRPIQIRYRPAFTLIEVLVAISVGSSIMITAIALLHKSFDLNERARRRVEQGIALDRFIEQFRTDVHAATECQAEAADRLLLKFSDEEEIVYSTSSSKITRALSSPRGSHVEKVELSVQTIAQFELSSSDRLAVLLLQQRTLDQSSRVLRKIEVAIGRFSASESASGLAEASSS